MRIIILVLLVTVQVKPSFGQFKKIAAYRDGKLDSLDFPNDFRERNGIKIGDKFPTFTYVDIKGDTISSTDFKDKLLVLNFWFVGCVGCRQEEPYLHKLTEELNNENIGFVSICQSSRSRIKSYINKYGYFGYKVISLNSKKEVANKFGVTIFTTHLVIKNGVVVENFSFPLTTDDEIGWFKDLLKQEVGSSM